MSLWLHSCSCLLNCLCKGLVVFFFVFARHRPYSAEVYQHMRVEPAATAMIKKVICVHESHPCTSAS